MPDDRTTVTELATALGTTGAGSLKEATAERPGNLAIGDESWERLERILAGRKYSAVALAAFANGAFFAGHPAGLDGRAPRLIEWSGDRRIPGDQAVPADLLVDRVYMISCKYLSQILHNTAPARVFEEILAPSPQARHPDWFAEVASRQHLALYRGALKLLDLEGMPDTPGWLDSAQRARLRAAFREHGSRGMPGELRAPYDALIAAVSKKSAETWQEALGEPAQQERLLWRLLRIYSATYYILGIDRHRTMRLRVMTPWEWRQAFEFRSLKVARPTGAGSRGSTGRPATASAQTDARARCTATWRSDGATGRSAARRRPRSTSTPATTRCPDTSRSTGAAEAPTTSNCVSRSAVVERPPHGQAVRRGSSATCDSRPRTSTARTA